MKRRRSLNTQKKLKQEFPYNKNFETRISLQDFEPMCAQL